jgi:hypothetical protein
MTGRADTSRVPLSDHRLRPVLLTSACVLATYAALQVVAGSTMTSTLWWQREWIRLRLHRQYPKASFAQPVPGPTWEAWLPSAATACVLVLALVLLALAVVSAGHGWWLLLVALLPLVPTPIAPGIWAPALSNQLMWAVVWPARATDPSTTWAWISAAIEAVVVAVPAMALRSLASSRRPAVDTSDVVRRLIPVATVFVAVVAWNWSAGEPQDWGILVRRAAFFVLGALVVSGARRRRWWVPLLAVLPAVSAGAIRWSTAVDGHASLIHDPAAWAVSLCFGCGGAWVLVQPSSVAAARWVRRWWTATLVAELSRPAHATATAGGGRHRQ